MKYRHDLGNDRWIVERIFPGLEKGFYIEAGATNGINGSATYVLEKELGWSGLCIEPIPTQNHRIKEFRDCLVDARALWRESGHILDFTIFPQRTGHSGLSSVNKSVSSEKFFKEERQVLKIQTVTLQDALDHHKAPAVIDYFCLDIEGAEPEVLSVFDFHGPRTIRAMSIEGTHCNEIMKSAGYRQVVNPFTDVTFETYWVHSSVDVRAEDLL